MERKSNPTLPLRRRLGFQFDPVLVELTLEPGV
jgi:hypothetical protein